MLLSAASGGLKEEECSGSSEGAREHITLSSLASEEDEDFHFDTSDSDKNQEVLVAGRRYPSIQEFASAIPNHLLLGSLLEHLCFVYESNPARSRTLFKVIGQRLAAMNLLSPLAISDEFSTVRLQHNRAFTELLNAASSSLCPQGQQRFGNSHSLTQRPKEGLFQAQTSRYLSEFEEMCKLGKGAYGNVWKVLNKLDGQYYAMKKILIKKVSKEDCMRVLREVKVLSSLQHVHVVGYHTAWMEHVQPTTYPERLLPALESPGQQDSSDESFDSSGSSSSIIFQSLSKARKDAGLGAGDLLGETPHVTDLVAAQQGPMVCPKTMRRVPENYVPCVFLGQREPPPTPKCPAMGSDTSVLFEEEPCRSGVELKNNARIDKASQQHVEKHTVKSTKEVQFHLMLYIQMQLCERSLKDWISERNARPKFSKDPYDCVDIERTRNILRCILEGVDYIHSRGIMHRDLKPRNIFLHGQDCHVRIGDFGLACKDIILDGREGPSCPGTGSGHTTGVGTFVYAAPEQLKGSHYNFKSDMYSIGVLAMELFQPFGTEMERVRTLGDLREGKIPESFSKRWPVLTKYIMELTSKEPRVRPTASQLLQSDLFCCKDKVIHGLQRRVEEQEEEILQLRKRISQLQSSQLAVGFPDQDKT